MVSAERDDGDVPRVASVVVSTCLPPTPKLPIVMSGRRIELLKDGVPPHGPTVVPESFVSQPFEPSNWIPGVLSVSE